MTRVNLGGNERPVVFNNYAKRIFEEATGQPFNKFYLNVVSAFDGFNENDSEEVLGAKLATNVKVKDLVALLYSCLMGGCRSEKVNPNFTIDDVYDWSDDAPESILYDCIGLMLQQSVSKLKIQAPAKDGAKKKK